MNKRVKERERKSESVSKKNIYSQTFENFLSAWLQERKKEKEEINIREREMRKKEIESEKKQKKFIIYKYLQNLPLRMFTRERKK